MVHLEDALRAKSANMEWIANSQQAVQHVAAMRKNSHWCPPPVEWPKCNFDCSYKHETNTAGIGWIVRDHNGSFVHAGSVKINHITSVLQGEAIAFLYALQQMWIKGHRHVWFEGDSVELARIINNRVPQHLELGNSLYDIRHWMSLLPLCSLEATNREKNMAADVLSRSGLQGNHLVTFYSCPPTWLTTYLYYPYTV